MKIIELIKEKQIEFIKSTSKEQTKLYLGGAELEELLDWITCQFDFPIRPKSKNKLKFSGMQIYEVKTEHHLNVS